MAACMEEINSFADIEEVNYEDLVSYKMCIVKNMARLTAAGLEHEGGPGVLGAVLPERVLHLEQISVSARLDEPRLLLFFPHFVFFNVTHCRARSRVIV